MAWFWFLGGACLVDLGLTVKNLIILCRRKTFKLVGQAAKFLPKKGLQAKGRAYILHVSVFAGVAQW
jgi:hypothetical protein